jgi:hypothetical protein
MLDVNIFRDFADWIFDVLAALGGLAGAAAVVVAVWQTRVADRRAQAADSRAVKAEAETAAAHLREEENRAIAAANERRRAIEAAADRQAVDIDVAAVYLGGMEPSGGTQIQILLKNRSGGPITNVEYFYTPAPWGWIRNSATAYPDESGDFSAHQLLAGTTKVVSGGKEASLFPTAYVQSDADHPGEHVHLNVTTFFTDRFGNRWALYPDRHLELQHLRTISEAEPMPDNWRSNIPVLP